MVFGGGGGDFGVRADSGRACREGQESMRHPHADLRSFQAKIAAEVRPQTPSVFDNFAQTRGGIASGPASAAGTSIADADAERGGGAQPAHAQPSYSSCPPSNLRRASRVTDRWRKATEGREVGGTRGRCSVGGETGASASPSDSRELAAAGHWSPAASSREAAQSHGSAHGQRRAAADRRSGRGGRVSNGRRTSDEPAPLSSSRSSVTSGGMS